MTARGAAVDGRLTAADVGGDGIRALGDQICPTTIAARRYRRLILMPSAVHRPELLRDRKWKRPANRKSRPG